MFKPSGYNIRQSTFSCIEDKLPDQCVTTIQGSLSFKSQRVKEIYNGGDGLGQSPRTYYKVYQDYDVNVGNEKISISFCFSDLDSQKVDIYNPNIQYNIKGFLTKNQNDNSWSIDPYFLSTSMDSK